MKLRHVFFFLVGGWERPKRTQCGQHHSRSWSIRNTFWRAVFSAVHVGGNWTILRGTLSGHPQLIWQIWPQNYEVLKNPYQVAKMGTKSGWNVHLFGWWTCQSVSTLMIISRMSKVVNKKWLVTHQNDVTNIHRYTFHSLGTPLLY